MIATHEFPLLSFNFTLKIKQTDAIFFFFKYRSPFETTPQDRCFFSQCFNYDWKKCWQNETNHKYNEICLFFTIFLLVFFPIRVNNKLDQRVI